MGGMATGGGMEGEVATGWATRSGGGGAGGTGVVGGVAACSGSTLGEGALRRGCGLDSKGNGAAGAADSYRCAASASDALRGRGAGSGSLG